MKLKTYIRLITLLIPVLCSGYLFAQDIVIPAESEDIEAFDQALMQHQNEIKQQIAEGSSKNINNDKKKNIDEEITKEANNLKDLDTKSKDDIKEKIEEKAHAEAKDIDSTASKKAGDVVTPPPSGQAASNKAESGK